MIDQLNRKVAVDSLKPLRIVSLVPSQTEFLHDIGLEEEVVGITKFCIHPKRWFKTKVRVGGTKNLNLNTIRSLKPTLILANKEENTQSQIEMLAKEYPVWISDISTFDEALDMMERIGHLVGKYEKAKSITDKLRYIKLNSLPIVASRSTLYVIWQNPTMVAGVDTFIHSMMELAGFQNVVALARYPELSLQEIERMNPDYVFLSSEPYPFKEKHRDEWQALLPKAKIKLVDGELFSWYGSRMLHSFDYFRALNEELAR